MQLNALHCLAQEFLLHFVALFFVIFALRAGVHIRYVCVVVVLVTAVLINISSGVLSLLLPFFVVVGFCFKFSISAYISAQNYINTYLHKHMRI